MNKHGMTLIELLGVIVVLTILSGLVVVSISSVFTTSQNGILNNYEKTMKSSAMNYYADNMDELPNENSSKKLYLSTLINKKYIDPLKGINELDCKTISNESFIYIRRNSNVGNNYNIDYEVCLICLSNTGAITYTTTTNCNN